MRKREKFIVIVIILIGLCLFLNEIRKQDLRDQKFWENKTEITELEQSKFPIKVETKSFKQRTNFINFYFSSSIPFCSGRDTICFIDFVRVGDKFHYFPKRNVIELYRDSSIYIFPKYIKEYD